MVLALPGPCRDTMLMHATVCFQSLLALQSINHVGPLTGPSRIILILLFESTDTDLKNFLKAHLYKGATDDQIDSIADKYPQDPAAVSNYLPWLSEITY